MTDQDDARFAAALLGLAEVLGESLSKHRLNGYFEALRDLDLETVEVAIATAIRTARFFPKPVELRELAGVQAAEDRGPLAWACLFRAVRSRHSYYESVRFEPPIMRAVVDLWGSWPDACEALALELTDPMLASQRKQFLALYAAYDGRPLPAGSPTYLVGELEKVNRENVSAWTRGGLPRQRLIDFPLEGEPVEERHPAPLALPGESAQGALPTGEKEDGEVDVLALLQQVKDKLDRRTRGVSSGAPAA
jgi:hypothetical protein